MLIMTDLAIYDTSHDSGKGKWVVEPGEYEIRVGASSQDIRLRTSVKPAGLNDQLSKAFCNVKGPGISDGKLHVDDGTFAAMLGHPVPAADPLRPYHLNTSLADLGDSRIGRMLMKKIRDRFRTRLQTG